MKIELESFNVSIVEDGEDFIARIRFNRADDRLIVGNFETLLLDEVIAVVQGHINKLTEDAKQHDRPWELWQHGDHEVWVGCTTHPSWYKGHSYRRKPQTIMLGEYEVPEPCREPLRSGQKFWVVNPFEGPQGYTWDGSKEDFHALKGGFVHLTEEAAEKHYKVFKNLLGKK